MAAYEHLSICAGKHENLGGECLVGETQIGEATVAIQGMPCDNASLWVDGFVNDAAELDKLISKLTELRPLLIAARADAECTDHDHGDDEFESSADAASEHTDDDTDGM